jgi:hypothetical protein
LLPGFSSYAEEGAGRSDNVIVLDKLEKLEGGHLGSDQRQLCQDILKKAIVLLNVC